MDRPLFTSIPYNGRTWYHLRYRIAVVLFMFGLIQYQRLFLLSRQSLRAKYSPTNFSSPSSDLYSRYPRQDDEDSLFQDELMANRAVWKVLGEGCEGRVFAHKDWVISKCICSKCV
jgi:hypothetical protein